MWFRNLTLFRFPETSAKVLKTLEDSLERRRLKACGPLQLSSQGFVSPYGRGEDRLVHPIGSFTLFTLGTEEKLLPAVVIAEALALKLDQIREKEARPVGGRERKRLKEEAIVDLLPRAFTRPSRLNGYIDLKSGWLILDTASRKAAEAFVSVLREALGTFPALPATAEDSPRAEMTEWLISGKLPKGFTLGDECELRDPAETGAIVRCRRQELESDEVREHLKSGKQVFQLGLQFEDRLAFVLGEDLVLRKLRFMELVQDELGEAERDSARAELDASFALMTHELERLLERLQTLFTLTRPASAKKH